MEESNKVTRFFSKYVPLFLGLFALLSIRSILNDDNSRIISKGGLSMLDDKKKIDDVFAKIDHSAESKPNQEIFI